MYILREMLLWIRLSWQVSLLLNEQFMILLRYPTFCFIFCFCMRVQSYASMIHVWLCGYVSIMGRGPEECLSSKRDEAYMVLCSKDRSKGNKPCLIGPVYPTYWLCRFFADMWILFTKEDEYIECFQKAGFNDPKIKRIGLQWYRGVRHHGLIIGHFVTVVKLA